MTGVDFEKRAHSRASGCLWDDENLATFLRSEDNRNIYFTQILFVFANLHVAIRDFPKPNPNLTLPLEEMMKKSVLPLVCAMMFSFAALAQDKAQPSQLTIHVRDYCDPTNFTAPFGNGVCNRDTSTGAITITGFLTELTMDKSVGARRFAPSWTEAAEGTTLNRQNLGGEMHTFTRVKRFGGGLVAPLNTPAGTPELAPECEQMVNGNPVPQPPARIISSFPLEPALAQCSSLAKLPDSSVVFISGCT